MNCPKCKCSLTIVETTIPCPEKTDKEVVKDCTTCAREDTAICGIDCSDFVGWRPKPKPAESESELEKIQSRLNDGLKYGGYGRDSAFDDVLSVLIRERKEKV
jgi:hypothetical protein